MSCSNLLTPDYMATRSGLSTRASFIAGSLALAGLLVAVPVLAHDGPAEVIERLTLKMERQGRSAELLYQRATEYRTLGKLKPATVRQAPRGACRGARRSDRRSRAAAAAACRQ